MSETVAPPTVQEPGTFRREETRAPDTGRSLSSALAEMQRRRVEPPAAPAAERVVPASQSPMAPAAAVQATAPQLPPPDATMAPAPQPPPASQQAGTAPADMVVQVQIDGQLVPMTIAELQQGYMRREDYSRKTQQASTELRKAQEAQQAFANARAVMEQRLPAMIAAHQNEFSQPIDWEKLSREDPIGTSQKMARLLAWQQAVAEGQHLETIKQNEERARKEQLRLAGHDLLGRIIPGWADGPTRVVIQQALRDHAISLGWPAEEVDRAEVLDPRYLFMCWKSMNYDRLMAQAPRPQPVGVPAHPTNGVARRAPGETAQLSELEERFAQTHRLDDAVAVSQARAANGMRPATPPRQTSRYR